MTGDIRILAEMVTTGIVTVSVLHLQDTLVWGDLQVFRGMQHASKARCVRLNGFRVPEGANTSWQGANAWHLQVQMFAYV